MRRFFALIAVAASLAACSPQDTQGEIAADILTGNRLLRKGDLSGAESAYREALAKDSLSLEALYDLSSVFAADDKPRNALDSLTLAGSLRPAAGSRPADRENPGIEGDSYTIQSDIAFNKGVACIALEDWKGAVDAFRESLLVNPNDIPAKENFLYAQKKLEDQQNQNQDQDQNQDQNQNQDRKQDQPQSRPQEQKISQQQAQQMLNAIQAREKKTQEKVDAQKENAALLGREQTEKNW